MVDVCYAIEIKLYLCPTLVRFFLYLDYVKLCHFLLRIHLYIYNSIKDVSQHVAVFMHTHLLCIFEEFSLL